jgi:hypothetical protein
MRARFWRVLFKESHHTVEVEHNFAPGRRTIRVDGQVIHESRHWLDLGSEHPFELEGHACCVTIRRTGWAAFEYELTVDGRPLACM